MNIEELISRTEDRLPNAARQGRSAEGLGAKDVDWGVSVPSHVELDIGCSNGRFLVDMAQVHPERYFLGIERQSSRVFKTNKKILRLGLSNAEVRQGEGLQFLKEMVPDKSVNVLHVLFPDPWPKRRHAVRRLMREAFLQEAWRCLKPEGLVRFRTDAQAYHQEVAERAQQMGCWAFVELECTYPLTDFESRFRAQGLPIYSLALGKK